MNDQNNIKTEISVCSAGDFGIVGDVVVASPLVISQSVRVHLQNSRQGTLGCKSRSDLISRSNKKPWKQKGTGRARAGSPRSPLWRGGGVCFGPQARVRVLSMPQKMNKKSLEYLFFDLLDSNKIISLDFDVVEKSTKNVYLMLKKIKLDDKKIVLLYDINDVNVYYSFSNLKNVKMVSFDAIYPYILANDSYLLFLKKNKKQFEDVVNSWLN